MHNIYIYIACETKFCTVTHPCSMFSLPQTYDFSHAPLCYDLGVSARLMGSVNSEEWGDDLPPHPSPGDGHGKPVPDRLGWGVSGGAQGTNGVKDRTEEGSLLPQHGGWKNRAGGVEKCGQDWGQGRLNGVLGGPQLARLNVCVTDKDYLTVFAFNKQTKKCIILFYLCHNVSRFQRGGGGVSAKVMKSHRWRSVQFSSWHLWKSDQVQFKG